ERSKRAARRSSRASRRASPGIPAASERDREGERARQGGGTMLGTMQDFPLTVTMLLRHGAAVHGRSQVVTFEGEESRRATFAEVAARAERLAAALARLGIAP